METLDIISPKMSVSCCVVQGVYIRSQAVYCEIYRRYRMFPGQGSLEFVNDKKLCKAPGVRAYKVEAAEILKGF